ncbi:MAG: hypothetical protein JZU53_05555 [Paludibacter sp.]|nr:hypothetical protein [Paludibacter sp.]
MKPNLKILTLLLLMATSCVVLPRQVEAQESTISLQVFYDELSPYGQWIDYRDYGYVWIPNAEPDFVPYSTDGHWILTEYGWTWASDYDWGWATFHYGRWSFDNSFGWFWVPDNEWGPAWVNWRQYNGYYGWSPMEPGISLSISFGRSYYGNNDHWLFVRDRDFERSDMNRYYVGRSERDRMVRNSTIIKRTYVDRTRNTTYVSGPSRESVQRATGRTIKPVAIREYNKPGQNLRNGQLEIYRPRIGKDKAGRKTSPTRVASPNDVKRNQGNRQPTQSVNNNSSQNNSRPANKNNVTSPVQQNRNIKNNEPDKTKPVDRNKSIRQPNKADIQNNQPNQQRNMNQQYNNRQNRNINQPANHDRNRQTQQPGKPIQEVQSKPIIQQPERRNEQNNNGQRNIPRTVNEDRRDVQNTARPAKEVTRSQQEKQQNVRHSNDNKPAKEEKSVNQRVKEEQAKSPDQETNKR